MTTQTKQLKNALKHLQDAMKSLSATKKRKKKNPCKRVENPRVHFPKTKRGRPTVKRMWTITINGAPPLRFKATKVEAYSKARKLSASRGKVVLDGPK